MDRQISPSAKVINAMHELQVDASHKPGNKPCNGTYEIQFMAITEPQVPTDALKARISLSMQRNLTSCKIKRIGKLWAQLPNGNYGISGKNTF